MNGPIEQPAAAVNAKQDHASVIATAIIQIVLQDLRPRLEALLRDELAAHARQVLADTRLPDP